jgi:hypothetical protein
MKTSSDKLKFFRYLSIVFVLNFVLWAQSGAQQIGGLQSDIIVEKSENLADFPIVSVDHSIASIRYDENDYKGVIRDIGDLQSDIDSITGVKPELLTTGFPANYEIIVGTLGKNKLIDQLVSSKKLDVKDLKGKWESFVITTMPNPQPGTKQ